MATFKLDIVTPEGAVFSGEVEHVRAPGVKGSFGVLPDHTPFITPLDIGVIEVRIGGVEKRFATSGGLAEITSDQMKILAGTAEAAENIDIERAQEAVKRNRERIDKRIEGLDVERARRSMERSQNRLNVAAMK